MTQSTGIKSYRRAKLWDQKGGIDYWTCPLPSPTGLHICHSPSLKFFHPDPTWLTVIQSRLKWNTLRKAYSNSCCCPPTPPIALFQLFQRMYSHLEVSYFKSKDLIPCSFLYLLNLERGLALIYLMGEMQGWIILATPCLFQITSFLLSRKKSLLIIPSDSQMAVPYPKSYHYPGEHRFPLGFNSFLTTSFPMTSIIIPFHSPSFKANAQHCSRADTIYSGIPLLLVQLFHSALPLDFTRTVNSFYFLLISPLLLLLSFLFSL